MYISCVGAEATPLEIAILFSIIATVDRLSSRRPLIAQRASLPRSVSEYNRATPTIPTP
jgi:hypothetical protein